MAVRVSYFHALRTLMVFLLFLSSLAEITVRKCFKGSDKEPQGQATLSCPAGYVISITDAILGKNKWFECVLTEEDCMHSTKIFSSCEGLNSCNKIFRTYSARCGYSTILLISYRCAQVSIPSTPINITTTATPNVGGEGGPSVRVTSGGSATGNNNRVNVKPYRKKETDNEDDSEVGLLVATICASLITGVMLIIAIVMTIRRILNYPAWLQHRNRENSSRWHSCMERACFQVDKFPCFSGPEPPEGSQEQALRSQIKSNRTPLSVEDTVPAIHPARMTPIGQEASDSDVIAQPKNIVNRDEDPEGSDISEHAQTPDIIDVKFPRSTFKVNHQNGALGSNTSPVDLEYCNNSNGHSVHDPGYSEIKTDVAKLSNYNSVKYSSRNNENRVNEIGKFTKNNRPIQSSKIDYKSQCYSNHINNNNNVCKNSYDDVVSDIDVSCADTDKHNNNNNINDEADYTTIESKYSAIVVPNTETSSKC